MLKITIITICYNEKERLKKTIDGVCFQTYENIEYLIIDGDSTDGTQEMVQEYLKNNNIHFFSEKDYGIYNAMNRGIARASGDYICFINAGDVFYNPNVISDVVSCMGEDKETIYYGKTCRVYADGLKQIEDLSSSSMTLKEIVANGGMPCHQSIFAPRKALTNHYFREQYKIRADFEWLLYSLICGWKHKQLTTIICYYDMSGVSSRLKNMELLKKEEKDILKEYELILSQKFTGHPVIDIERMEKEIMKYVSLFQLMNYWMILKQKKISIGKLLKQKGYKHIAVYGISHMGLCLLEDLREEEIIIDYAIDRNENISCLGVKIVLPEATLDEVDVIIVTAPDAYYEIKKSLKEKINCPILSLEDLLYEMGNIDKKIES